MYNRNPMPLTRQEWDEVAEVPEVRMGWGLAPDERGPALASVGYGTRFDFISGGPGYVGDFFVIAGDALSAPPMVLIRNDDRSLRVAKL